VELSLLAVRTVDPVRHAAFFLNGRLLTDVAADASGCRLSIGIEPRHLDGSQAWLMMCVRPWRLPRRIDPRELGLAVLAIAVRSDGGAPGDAHA
jgi:hypothetical protein